MPADSFEDSVPPLAQGLQESLDAGLDAEPEALSAAAAEAAAALDTPPPVAPPAFATDAAPAAAPPAPARPPVREPPAASTAPTPTPAPAPTSAADRWAVQLGSFASRANAEKLLGSIKASGVGGFILPLTEGGKTSFRVRAGPVAGRAAADRLRQDLERTQSIRGMLVRYP